MQADTGVVVGEFMDNMKRENNQCQQKNEGKMC